MARTNRLIIWMNGIRVGYWEQVRSVDRLCYLPEWTNDPAGRPLSLSLPFTPGNQPFTGNVVARFFDNLLPDSGEIRRRMAIRYRTGGVEPFQLLSVLGRDCVGAIQLLPEKSEPAELDTIQSAPLTESHIARLLRQTVSSPQPGLIPDEDDDLRLSIAGAQEKTALLFHENQWLLPHGSTPTTHILKLPMGLVGGMQADMATSVENEWLCAQIVAAYGLPVAECAIARFEEQKALIVKRFDRRYAANGEWILRLPQEDMCQATGTSAYDKYQSDGGPSIGRIMQILQGSSQAEQDCLQFFKAQLVFWLLAATDGHAKNFSIFHLSGGRFHATPLYDILSAHPIIGTGHNQLPPQKAKLAMAVRGSSGNHYLIHKIQPRHWLNEAQKSGLGLATGEAIIAELVAQTPQVIEKVAQLVPLEFPIGLAESIFSGLERQSKKLVAL